MGANTHIEWCDHTFNPWEGCTKISPGCANCYAETRNARFGGGSAPNWGKGAPRRRTSASNWAQPVKWDKEAAACLEMGGPGIIRPRVFCASLADWLDDEVPLEWLADLLTLIHSTQNLDWLLLTKRPENWKKRLLDVLSLEDRWGDGDDITPAGWMIDSWQADEPPANVWIGTTVEDQIRADERIPALLSIPARVRFLSCEPLLSEVDLHSPAIKVATWRVGETFDGPAPLTGLHWVICGGESGPKARPMHPDWARSLRDQCAAAGVPFLFKQWGEWAPGVARLKRYDPAKPTEYVNEVRWVSTGGTVGITEHTKQCNLTTPLREPHRFEDGEVLAYKVGKVEAGRLLDGVEHNQFPEGSQ